MPRACTPSFSTTSSTAGNKPYILLRKGAARLPQIAKVAVSDATIHFDKLYSYRIPPELEGRVWPGSMVLAPFGAGNHPRMAVVLECAEDPAPDARLKTLLDAAPEEARLTPDLIALARFLKDRTFCTWFEAVKAMIPYGAQYQPAKENGRWVVRSKLSRTEETVYTLAGELPHGGAITGAVGTYFPQRVRQPEQLTVEVLEELCPGAADWEIQKELNRLDFTKSRVITLTCHRRENYGAPMEQIMAAVRTLVEENPQVEVVYPVHLSPVVQDCARRFLDGLPRVHLIAPLDVAQMHNLLARSYLVLTDSGGLQEEAPALGKPVLVLRRETERPEAIAAGTVRLAGVETEQIVAMTHELLKDEQAYAGMARAVNPYGDGNACRRIADAIAWHFGLTQCRPENFETGFSLPL